MDETTRAKNHEARERGAEYMLGRFANLPDKSGNPGAAKEFQERFGVLFPGLAPQRYHEHVAKFRKAWRAKSPLELEALGLYFDNVFNRKLLVDEPKNEDEAVAWVLSGDPRYRPAIRSNPASGKIEITTEATLLDWLVVSLWRCLRRLAICARPGCRTPYFVKTHSRMIYCSPDCSHEARQQGQNEWGRKNRGKGVKHSKAKSRRKRDKR